MGTSIDIHFFCKENSIIDKKKIDMYSDELEYDLDCDLILIAFLKHLDDRLSKDDDEINNLIIGHRSKINKKDFFIRYYNGNYYIGNFVGIIKDTINYQLISDKKKNITLNVTLEVITRFDDRKIDVKNKKQKIFKPYFLCSLLQCGDVYPNNDELNSSDDTMFDFLLLQIYKKEIKDLLKMGYYQTYQNFQGNDSRFHGIIDIPRHIKENVFVNNGKIAYKFREKSCDNYINHLIIAGYRYLKKRYFQMTINSIDNDYDVKNYLYTLDNMINSSAHSIKELISKNINPISHPYYYPYEKLRKICLKILRNEGASIFNADKEDKIDGILYYVPDLWEQFIENKVILNREGYNVSNQSSIDIFDNNDDDWRQETRPDFVIEKGNEPYAVLDAKFVENWYESLTNSKSPLSNVFNDFDKCIRDMRVWNVKIGGVIFPINIRNYENSIKHKISKYCNDNFYTFYLNVPSNRKESNNWNEEFKQNIEELQKNIDCYLFTK